MQKEDDILTGIMGAQKSTEQNKRRMSTPAFIVSILALSFVVIGGAVFIGKSDQGQINVNAAIQSSNQKNIDAGGNSNNTIGTVPEVFRNMPNGGLEPQGDQASNAQPETAEPTREENAEAGTTTESNDASTTEVDSTETTDVSTGGTDSQDAGQ